MYSAFWVFEYMKRKTYPTKFLQMRDFSVTGLVLLLLNLPSTAEADCESRSYNNGTYAALSMTLPTSDERHALLTIDFDARQNCSIYAGVNVYKGSKLGTPVSQEQMNANSMYVQTAGLRWSGGETKVIYSNGFEAMMAIGEDFIESIKKRGTVYAQVENSPIYEFPSGRNFGAIEVARQGCWAMR